MVNVNKMNTFNLIPFGQKSDGSFVDIAHVEKGKNCNCTCPSCHMPLIAKQGDIKEWHFAHLSNKESIDRTENACEYSFFVSVHLMAMQLIKDHLSMALPALKGRIFSESIRDCGGTSISETFTVTETKNIKLSNVEVKKSVSGKVADIVGIIGNYSFVIVFSYPGREIPMEYENPADKKCGIIEVSLDATQSLFFDTKDSDKSYQEVLYEFIKNNIDEKRWLYHPRFQEAKVQAKQRLEAKKEEYINQYEQRQNKLPSFSDKSPDKVDVSLSKALNEKLYTQSPFTSQQSTIKALYQCLNCQHEWTGLKVGPRTCPRCEQYLYTRLVKTLDGYK